MQMLNRKTIVVLAVFLCVCLIAACAATPPPGIYADIEEEEPVAYEENEPDILDDYPEEPEEPEPEEEEEPEEEPEDDELEPEPEPEEAPQPAAQAGDAAAVAQGEQQQPAPATEEVQPEPAPQQEPAPQAEPEPAQAGQGTALGHPPAQTVAGSDFEMEVIRQINMQRQVAGLSQLTANSLLMQGARIRAQELERTFSHNRPNGSGWQTVLSDVGYSNTAAGENIAAGQVSPAAVVSSWMGSQGHRNNILSGDYTETGVGAVLGSDGRWRWVQLFGGPGGGAAGGGASPPADQGGGVTWVPSLAQYHISAPPSGHLGPGDVLRLVVATSDPSIPFTYSWSAPRSNQWWSFRDGVLEVYDFFGPGTPPLQASVRVFEFGNPVTELSVELRFGS